MNVTWTKRLIGRGEFAPSPEWAAIRDSAVTAIEAVDWPTGSGNFTINPTKKGNGVVPIKERVASLLAERGWETEERWPIPDINLPGRMDGAYRSTYGLVAFEWETGNVASSHRSINKMCLGLTIGAIAGGLLAVSSRELAQFLTDRVGNIEEIRPYFPLWEATPCETGILEILVVQHDRRDDDAPLIPKAKTGRAAIA